jgi:hypothetical protein
MESVPLGEVVGHGMVQHIKGFEATATTIDE